MDAEEAGPWAALGALKIGQASFGRFPSANASLEQLGQHELPSDTPSLLACETRIL